MRRYRAIILLALLGILPLAVAVFVVLFSPPENEPKQPAQHDTEPVLEEVSAPAMPSVTYKVLVAARRLPDGTVLREGDLTELEVEAKADQPESVVTDSEAVADRFHGYVVRDALAAGAPLKWANVVGPGERGFLASVLKPGTRAITIPLDTSTQHAGLIDPGDRVDVILVASLRSDGAAQDMLLPKAIVVEDVQVLAVDRQVWKADESPGGGDQVERTEIETATLEVFPVQAELLVFGEQEGELRLMVRSLVDAGQRIQSETMDLQELLPAEDQWDEDQWEEDCGADKTVRIIRGSVVTYETFFENCFSSKEYQTQPQGIESEF